MPHLGRALEGDETMDPVPTRPEPIIWPRVRPDDAAGPASRAFADRVARALDEACWYCRDGRPRCGACGRGV